MPERGNNRLVILMGLAFLSVSAGLWGADHYVRSGATGTDDGSDWTNAWTVLPSRLVRGDTYYVAGGVYPPCVFDDPEEGTEYIRILKAVGTPGVHGTDVGWDSSFGDGVAEFTGNVTDFGATVIFTTGYWIMDGVTGSDRSPRGFKLTTTNDASSYLVRIGNGADWITISHVEMKNQTMGQLGVLMEKTKGINATSALNGGSSYLTISDNYIHDVTVVMLHLNNVRNSMVEHNYFENRLGGDYIDANGVQTYIHGEAISMNYCGLNANNTIRFNTFKDINGTAFIAVKDSVQSGFHIYGNVFFETSSMFSTSNGAIANTVGDTNTDMHVFNNTFANLHGRTGIVWYDGLTNEAQNNIWYNCGNVMLIGTSHNSNGFFLSKGPTEPDMETGSRDPFLNMSAFNFQLTTATLSGISFPPPYNRDMQGNFRGGDGGWDRGAYEYVGTPDVVPPSTPTGLSVMETLPGEIHLTWEASSDNMNVAYYVLYRNGGPFETVLQTEYIDKEVAPQTTYTYQVLAVDMANNSSGLSDPLTVQMPADTVPPSILEITASRDSVVLLFSEPVLQTNLSSASEIAEYYAIAPALSVYSVSGVADPPSVILHTEAHSWGTTYTLQVQRIQDLSGNVIPPTRLTYSYGNVANPEGLVAYWKFDENTTATVRDHSGNDNTGTPINGPQQVPGVSGLSLLFNGVDNSVDCGNKSSLNLLDDSFTVCMWVRVLGFSGSDCILDKGGLRKGFYLRTHSDQTLLFKIDDGTTDLYAQSDDTRIMDGRWHYVVGVLDRRSSVKLYIDGVPQSRIFNGPLSRIGSISNTDSLSLGSTSYGTMHFNGQIDEVRVYDRALPLSSIRGLGKPVGASVPPEHWQLY